MKTIKLKARAKINLTLDVIGKRENGYHDLKMIMQTVGLHDNITLTQIPENEIRLSSNMTWLPTDERNLAWRAAQLMKQTYGIKEGIAIDIYKRIPVAAGLAGGSADCAAVLVGMNQLFSLHLPRTKLEELALTMGTDIPYCVRRGTVLAEGLGNELTNIQPPCPFCYVVLVKLPVNVSTAKVYQSLHLDAATVHPDTEAMLCAMKEGNLDAMGYLLCNVLETVTIPMHPTIETLKSHLCEHGASGALMSGSGPTVFGLFAQQDTAVAAANAIKQEFHIKDVFVTHIYHTPHSNTRKEKKR